MRSYGIGSRKRWCLAAAVAAMVAVAAVASTAQAAPSGAEWAVRQIVEPTHIAPGGPRNEVQQLTVTAKGGTFALVVPGAKTGALPCEENRESKPIPYGASAPEVGAAVSEVCGGVAIEASGPAGGPYRLEFVGNAAARPFPDLVPIPYGLTGAGASAVVKQLVEGARTPIVTVLATNVGAAATDGGPITIEDTLPAGFETFALAPGFYLATTGNQWQAPKGLGALCHTLLTVIQCTVTGPVPFGGVIWARIPLGAAPTQDGVFANKVTVAGGGAAEATVSEPLTISEAPVKYGIAPESALLATSTSQAGAHPNVTSAYAVTTSELGHVSEKVKDVRFDLPPGLVGTATRMPRCTMAKVLEYEFEPETACPRSTIVGAATVDIANKNIPGPLFSTTPIFNIAPAPGEPAAFGFYAGFPVRLDTSVLSNGEYGVRVTASDITAAVEASGGELTFWGVPDEHNGPGQYKFFHIGGELGSFKGNESFGGPTADLTPVPLLTNPQECGRPLPARAETDSWTKPGAYDGEAIAMGELAGCNLLAFRPTFTMLPDTLEAGAPAGYSMALRVPQTSEADQLATPTVNKVVAKLPEGVVVNPAAAWGLQACTNAQFYGPPISGEEPAAKAACPREAQVGTVTIHTPALEEAMEGQVYLATPECDPCTKEDAADGKMVRLFVQAYSEGEGGIVVKLEGKGHIDQATGQIETTFEKDPPLPFSEFKMELNGGPRAVLANPRTCGKVDTAMELTPWNIEPEVLAANISSPFEINENCHGPEFHPSFKAGMPNIQAGGGGEFTLAFGRPDNSEMLKSVAVNMPEGLMGSLDGIPLCPQAQANAGECSAASLLGTAEVLTGPGADPFLVSGGKVFLTEGYGGAPYGLSIVVPAVAGPYTLAGTTGKGTVVVRAQIFVNRRTAQLSVVSGEMPHMLDGIPLQLKAVNVRIDRKGFMFNPTSCDKMAITGTIDAVEGMSANVQSPFQVANCARLAFKPHLTAATSAHTSRKDGASLRVKITYPQGAKGQDANLRYVKVALPEALPSVLKTLKQACTEQQFAVNPAGCPEGSVVGHAVVHTSVLPVPLEGPAYFVSHGGAHWPELIMVLQGYGVTIQLNGETHISKGVTTSTFRSTPDVPFESFEVDLPQGPHSALAANGNLCYRTKTKKRTVRVRRHGRWVHRTEKLHYKVRRRLIMPTRLIGQNGKAIDQKTHIYVDGCGERIEERGVHVKGEKATIVVHVPYAGKLTANGKGISKVSKRTGKKGGRIALTVRLKHRLAAKLRRSRSSHVKVRVHLRFKAHHHKTLKANVKVKLH